MNQVGDKVKVKTKNGNKIYTISKIDGSHTSLSNKKNTIVVNSERVVELGQCWRGATLQYQSFN